eukprot:gnl/TRDRNA2_/TRDRNA2_74045_c0_seq1.p2 gnl/TRDRNA2_/TRDRNA2_74045_c0~~gnl/TRDRNA2_/TRDRNA2_74045_c0_seq1.p2  ORF type:complete len:114 (+),score=15.32 gnl/TRDRNA2_/TRDRNA2_74045_c0_seq1:2-343(+)
MNLCFPGSVRLSPHIAGSVLDSFLLSVASALAAAFGLALIGLLVSHLVFLTQNLTTIEANFNGPNPYHFGWITNAEQLLGAFDVFWLLPVLPRRPMSDGITFPIRLSLDESYS